MRKKLSSSNIMRLSKIFEQESHVLMILKVIKILPTDMTVTLH